MDGEDPLLVRPVTISDPLVLARPRPRLEVLQRVLAVAALAGTIAGPLPACVSFGLLTVFWDPGGLDISLEALIEGPLPPFENLRPLEAYFVFRQLTDQPIAAEDRGRLLGWRRAEGTVPSTAESPQDRWLSARASVLGSNRRHRIETYRWSERYQAYHNCLDDAFRVATRTLEARTARWGRDSPMLKEWLDGQDRVFANCDGEEEQLPQPLDQTWPEDLRLDREYQIAAAMFYAERWSEAERRFLAIADQERSPWRATSAYVAARAMLRQGRLEAAIEQLRSVISAAEHESIHDAARRFLRHCRYRHEPSAIHAETRQALLAGPLDADFDHRWTDYLWGLDRNGDLGDDFDLWMLAVTGHGLDGDPRWRAVRPRVQARWRQTANRVWLLAALAVAETAPGSHSPVAPADLESLLEAAATTPEETFAAPAVAYHRARLLTDLGRFDEAQTLLEALRARGAEWPLGTRNRLRQLEARVAPDLKSLLEASVSEAVALVSAGPWESRSEAVGLDRREVVVSAREQHADFDRQAGAILDLGVSVLQRLPLASLAELAMTSDLPPGPEERLLTAAFVRALLAEDHRVALDLARRIEQEIGSLAGGARTYLQSAPAARDFAAALFLLWAPGVQPFFHYGVDRAVGSWWCGESIQSHLGFVRLPRLRVAESFAVDSRERMRPLKPAPEFFAESVFPWAAAQPQDPRVPEALHRLVVSTRWACGPGFGAISKRAFDLLHRRYPTSPWTEKTPYWFGG